MLAIVIPYYKIIFFEKTLESLAQQTDKRFRVYIGDDASPNSPLELLKKYEGQFNYTYKRFNDNLGGISLVKQWERCIAMMQDEEWFMILGDDDVLGGNVVETFYENLDILYDINVVKYSQCLIDESGKNITPFTKYPKINKVYDLWLKKVDFRTRSSLSEHIFRTSIFKKYNFREYPLAWTTDDMMVFEIKEFKNILFMDGSKVFVRVTSQSISGTNDNINLKNYAWYLYYKDILTDYWHKIPNSDFRFLSLRFKYYAKLSKKPFDEIFILKKFFAKHNYLEYLKYLLHKF